jgi:hypothetical protein
MCILVKCLRSYLIRTGTVVRTLPEVDVRKQALAIKKGEGCKRRLERHSKESTYIYELDNRFVRL